MKFQPATCNLQPATCNLQKIPAGVCWQNEEILKMINHLVDFESLIDFEALKMAKKISFLGQLCKSCLGGQTVNIWQ